MYVDFEQSDIANMILMEQFIDNLHKCFFPNKNILKLYVYVSNTGYSITSMKFIVGILSPAPSPSDTGSGSDVDSCTEYDGNDLFKDVVIIMYMYNLMFRVLSTLSKLIYFLNCY